MVFNISLPQTMKRAIPSLLSASDIARRLGRTPKGVKDTLLRLGIQPDMTSSRYRYYRQEREQQVAAAMRAPNTNTPQG
jgi:hypothetical protein